MEETYFPTVTQAVPGTGYQVYAYFTDGSIHLYDMAPLVARGGVFAPLQDMDYFRNKLTVLNNTIAWDVTGNMDATKCIDIDPFDVYEAPAAADPLEDVG